MSVGRFHLPYKLSVLQRSFLIPYFGFGALLDPTRGDLVAGFGDVTGGLVLKNLHKKIISSESGRILMREKPIITEENLNLPKLRSLPETSFGNGYAKFMDHHGFSADERSEVRFMTDSDLAYTMARYRQVHDFWHVLAGLPPTVLGEVALKCFEFRVTGLPVCALGGVLGQLKLDAADLSKLHRDYIPWAIRAGGHCGDLMSYTYEQNLERPLVEVRQELNFEPIA